MDLFAGEVTITDVLKSAGIDTPTRRLCCPIHGGNNPTSFAHTDYAFICHSCGASGGLLDLIQYLNGCDREEAVRRLCELAGVPFQPAQEQGERSAVFVADLPRSRIPKIDLDFQKLKQEFSWTQLYQEGLHAKLRIIRRNVTQGKMPLEEFYAQQQLLLYELEELDQQLANLQFQVNSFPRGGSHDNHSNCGR